MPYLSSCVDSDLKEEWSVAGLCPWLFSDPLFIKKYNCSTVKDGMFSSVLYASLFELVYQTWIKKKTSSFGCNRLFHPTTCFICASNVLPLLKRSYQIRSKIIDFITSSVYLLPLPGLSVGSTSVYRLQFKRCYSRCPDGSLLVYSLSCITACCLLSDGP